MRAPLVADTLMTFGSSALRLLALSLLIAGGSAHAKREEPARLALAADATADHLQQQRDQIEQALKDTQDYAELRASDRQKLRDTMDQMARQLETAGSLAALADADRSAVLSQQDQVNSVLETGRNDSRVVCTREKEMGSNFRRSVCLTVAQRRRTAEQAQMMTRPQS